MSTALKSYNYYVLVKPRYSLCTVSAVKVISCFVSDMSQKDAEQYAKDLYSAAYSDYSFLVVRVKRFGDWKAF